MIRPNHQPGKQREARIDLRIERLVLNGLSLEAGDRERFRAGLESELARLLTEHGLPGRPDHATARNDHGTPRLVPVDLRGGSVVDSASRVAHRVYETIHREVRS
jgi:hypothetical protein